MFPTTVKVVPSNVRFVAALPDCDSDVANTTLSCALLLTTYPSTLVKSLPLPWN